jgi:hypothetical protein
VDVAEPPRIALESPESCADAQRVQALLHLALASARAPGRTWIVAMSVERMPVRALRAEADITDDSGTEVAHRVLSEALGGCDGLARAVGVWASLVLDAELARSRAAASAAAPEAAKVAPAQETPWPAPAAEEKPSPEHSWYLHHDDERTLEIGVGTFLMAGGTSGSAVAGATPFVIVEAGQGLFLRPALFLGETWTTLAPQSSHEVATWAAARFDTCLRIPGLYNEHRGIQLDLCGGAEGGFTDVRIPNASGVLGSTNRVPYAALGPGVDLRGELGSALSVALRGVGGYNVLQDNASRDPPLLSARVEVGLSWRIR